MMFYPGAHYTDVLLKINNVCVSYNDKQILRGVCGEILDLVIPGRVTGQVVAFLGPSGRGKTTLFRSISGLEIPTSGTVTLNNSGKPVQKGQVGVVPQNYPLFPWRTVLGNLLLAANQKETDPKVAKEKTLSLLDEFKLSDHKNSLPKQLSGGQRQRVSIIQQLLCSEHFLLMDEPFSGLDPINKKKVSQLINNIANRDELNTIIITTHDISTALQIADHVWLLGMDHNPDGSLVPGSYIKKVYDLVQMGLCWEPNIEDIPAFRDLVKEITTEFNNL